MPGPVGNFFNPGFFIDIVSNNVTIVLICVLLSLFYGAGAIFILNYNASILGVIYGSSVRPLIWGMEGVPMVFSSILVFVPHTFLEILGYLMAAISGGILSNAFTVRMDTMEGVRTGRLFLRDSVIFLVFAMALIIAGGFVETVLPPLFI